MKNLKFLTEEDRIIGIDDEGNVLAEVTFPEEEENIVNINHTFVDDSLMGHGVANTLIEKAYEKVKSENKKAIPTCVFAIKWFKEHLDKNDILA